MKSILGFLVVMAAFQSQAYDIITPGPAVSIGQGQVRSYVRSDAQGVPKSLGFWIQAKALEGLPASDTTYVIPMPPGTSVEPYNHLTMDWLTHGHEPDGVYSVPHFDFHFFFITSDERENTLCDSTDLACMKQPEPDYIPPNYIPTPEGVPKMGWHWVDRTSPEFNGQPFTATFIYGYYNGEVRFIEPMATLSFLTPTVSFEKDVPLPKKFHRKGYYPSKYSITYESPIDSYWVTLKNLSWLE